MIMNLKPKEEENKEIKNEETYILEDEEDEDIHKINTKDISKQKAKKKLGILNLVLLLLIICNLGNAIGSFFIKNAEDITLENYKGNKMCTFQGIFQNFCDLFALGLTTVISLIMRNSFKYILLRKLANKSKYFLLYSFLMPFVLSFG